MARQNAGRTIDAEQHVADRIRRELRSRGWSPAELASRMTKAGCHIQTSAIYKILNGDPPRTIGVDELVTLARIFESTPEDMLVPPDILDHERARSVINGLEPAGRMVLEGAEQLIGLWREIADLGAGDEELRTYLTSHFKAAVESAAQRGEVAHAATFAPFLRFEDERVTEAVSNLFVACMVSGGFEMWMDGDDGE